MEADSFASAAQLGEVSVVVNGVPLVLLTIGGDDTIVPAVPSDGSGNWANVWPTAQIAMFASVRMTDGEMWQVMMTQANLEGDYTISLGNPDTGVAKAFQIAAEDLGTPLWWCGGPPPSLVPVETQPDPPSNNNPGPPPGPGRG